MYSTPVQAGKSGCTAVQPETLLEITALPKGRKVILPTEDCSSSEISVFAQTSKRSKKKKGKPAASSTPRKRSKERAAHVYDSISSPSESETDKFVREAGICFEQALQGREDDPLTTFLQTTVPKVFSFLSLRQNSYLNSSEHEAREAIFKQQIDQIYATTKGAIVNKDSTIRDAVITEQSSTDPQDTRLQNYNQEQIEPVVTHSKSKTNVSIEHLPVASNSKEIQL